jgi:acetyl esterase/lipase
VPALIIRPKNLPSAAPALVYYHGGAFVMKPAPQHLENALRYASEAPCIVIFVEYRLAPRYRFPAGFNDCYAALRWTLANAATLGIDTARVAVGGDSAGGSLAAGIAQRAKEDGISLRAQLLVYPSVDLLCKRPSMTAYADVPPFDGFSSLRIAEMYVGPEVSQKVPAYASPLLGDLSQLAPEYVETPQFDPLHDQGRAYAEALTAKGVNVELNEIEGGVHGFDLIAASSTVAREAMRRRIEFLRREFAR